MAPKTRLLKSFHNHNSTDYHYFLFHVVREENRLQNTERFFHHDTIENPTKRDIPSSVFLVFSLVHQNVRTPFMIISMCVNYSSQTSPNLKIFNSPYPFWVSPIFVHIPCTVYATLHNVYSQETRETPPSPAREIKKYIFPPPRLIRFGMNHFLANAYINDILSRVVL